MKKPKATFDSTSSAPETPPLPQLDEARRKALIKAGTSVMQGRGNHPERSRAQLYEPNTVPLDLLHAYASLEKVLDRIVFGHKKIEDSQARLAGLFGLQRPSHQPDFLHPGPAEPVRTRYW